MHDAKGKPLAKGDRVLIPCEITELMGGEDFCNVSVRTVLGRRPDGIPETICAINTGVMLKEPDITQPLFEFMPGQSVKTHFGDIGFVKTAALDEDGIQQYFVSRSAESQWFRAKELKAAEDLSSTGYCVPSRNERAA